jgi:DNA-binding NarL/FixJ family response regulator
VHVVLAEDLALLRDGLTRMLVANGFEVVAAVADPDALAEALRDDTVDIAVIDVRLPPTFSNEGLVAAIEARRRRPGLPVLVLSQFVEQLYARELLQSGDGGIGYLLKDRVIDVDDFVDAVRRVAAGGTALDPLVVSSLLTHAGRKPPMARLSPRELEVLELMAQGRSNAAIAGALVITEKAVGKHSTSIFAKLDLPPDGDDNRRVLAVLRYLQAQT